MGRQSRPLTLAVRGEGKAGDRTKGELEGFRCCHCGVRVEVEDSSSLLQSVLLLVTVTMAGMVTRCTTAEVTSITCFPPLVLLLFSVIVRNALTARTIREMTSTDLTLTITICTPGGKLTITTKTDAIVSSVNHSHCPSKRQYHGLYTAAGQLLLPLTATTCPIPLHHQDILRTTLQATTSP